jgi:elongation factor 3
MAPALDIDGTHTPRKIKSENQISVKVLEEQLAKLSVSKAKDEISEASQQIATFINGDIEEGDAPTK